MSRVDVEPRLIRWAIERARFSPGELERRFPKVSEWATGDAAPTLRQLEQFAKATTTPVGYFFLPEPPEEKLPIADFRTMSDAPTRRPSPNLLETVYLMQRRQDFMREFLIDEGQDPIPIAGMSQAAGQPGRVSEQMREALGLTAHWASEIPTWKDALGYFREASEAAGVMVVINGVVGNNTHRKLDPEEFRGLALVDEYAPLVFVNGADAKAAQIFTLAHELAHVCTGEPGVSSLPRLGPTDHAVERFCNAVAAEFLVPEAALKGMWPQARTSDNPFQFLARTFKVSAVVIARRAFDLELIGRDRYRAFFDDAIGHERGKPGGGGDFWANQNQRVGRRFGRAVVQAAREGRLMYQSAYELSGLYGRTFDRYSELVAPRMGR